MMQPSLSVRTILNRTFGIYVERLAPILFAGLLVATLITPFPVLATTVLYFELRNAGSVDAPVDPSSPGALPA
jgi:hypothetical protein